MEFEFRETSIGCLREQAVEVIYQEESAELILPDSYPDVRTIVDTSAVCCLRDREVTAGQMSASGAFQATALFVSEGEGEVCALEAYLPFSVRLNRENIPAGGVGCAEIRIRAVDGRVLNSRKILVRVSYAVRLTAYEQSQLSVWDTEDRDGIQLLRSVEKAFLPIAVSEKSTVISEHVDISAPGSPVQHVFKVVPTPILHETKAVDDKAVVHGEVQLHFLYQQEDGGLGVYDTVLPLSQYLEFPDPLTDGEVRIHCCIREFQLEQDDGGGYLVTIGLLLQAFFWKQVEVPLITDGYAIDRSFEAVYEAVRLPALLDELTLPKTAEAALRGKPRRVIDCTSRVDFPACRREPDEISVHVSLTMHVLYVDESEQICGEIVKTETAGSFALHDGAVCYADADPDGNCYVSMSGDAAVVSGGVTLRARCFSDQLLQTMRGAEVGEPVEEMQNRPSLILRRCAGGERVWDVAKRHRTSVHSIQNANGLTGDTTAEPQLLLIPIG